jgi:PAS domain S-box-containing protein
MAFVVVQPLERHDASALADLLAKQTRMPVAQAEDGDRAQPNHVYIIPPNAALTLARGRLRVARPASRAGSSGPIDYFFQSLAEQKGMRAIGVVLSGAGSDGTIGLRALRLNGGLTLLQSPETAKDDSMPQRPIDAGLADLVLPVEQMPARLQAWAEGLARHPLVERLEKELQDTRADLQAAMEELASSNEELKASNEELRSSNEELASSNERLQSANGELRRIEEALRDSAERLGLAFEAARAGAWEWDLRTNANQWSDELWTLYGLDPQSVEPSYEAWRGAVHPDDRARAEAVVQEAAKKGTELNLEFRVGRPEGAERWLFSRARPLRDAKGQVARFNGIVLDITERKRAQDALRESQGRYRSLFENMLEGFAFCRMIYDERGRPIDFLYLDVNEAFSRLTGLAQVIGKRVTEVIPGIREAEPQLLETYGRVASTAQPERFEIHFKPLDLWLSIAVYSPLPEHFVAVFDNITARKRAEVEREALLEALREADRRKTEFLAVLSHELRNPLTPIRNSLHILARAAPGGEQAQRAGKVIERQVTHMARLVDDLLDVTRISRGKIQLQREALELGELVRRTVEDHRSMFLNNGVALEAELGARGLWTHGDPTRLAQVVGNLLQNAAKFTPRGGRTTVALERSGEEQALLRVADTGAGIAAGVLERLFEPFTQAEATLDRSRGGLGLGLSLVKRLVEMHGGSVSVTSLGVGQGAQFAVSLPLMSGAGLDEVAGPAPSDRGNSRRVLLIEDNVDTAESLREALELDAHAVEVAHTGPAALEKARAFKPDIVFCDIGLPGMDGYAVARAMRADPALARLPLVALTGYAAIEDVEKARAAGFDYHLAKPPTMEALERLLSRLVPPRAGEKEKDGSS